MILQIVSYDGYLYDVLKLEFDKLSRLNRKDWNLQLSKGLKKKTRWRLDCVYVHYLVKELSISKFYLNSFLKHSSQLKKTPNAFVLDSTKVDLTDYEWNKRMYHQIRECCELDHALSWLSTLGGAFSALGDYFERCADIAGKISIHQFKLALKLGDPSIASRCRLYLALSLIQKKRFKLAKRIVQNEYKITSSQAVIDERLLKMCQGIWSKLRYEWEREKTNCKNKEKKI